VNEVFILDACALLALLKNERGADEVALAYEKANHGEALLIMNKINLFEVYYGMYHDRGKDYAEKILDGVKRSIVTISEFSDDVFAEAGRLKATYRISLADSIALAQALLSGGALLTADHHEFDVIEGCENITFQWIR